MKTGLLLILFYLLTAITASGQRILYKSDRWQKNNGDYVYVKVEISQTDKNFIVTLGTKSYTYKILSSHIFSGVRMDYTVERDGIKDTLIVADMMDGTYAIRTNNGTWYASELKKDMISDYIKN